LPILVRILLLLVVVPLAVIAEETPYSQLYFRDIRSKDSVLHILRGRAIVRKCDAVLVVFDTVTFDPPPGQSEFNLDAAYRSDLSGWLDALSHWSAKSTPLYAATTISSKPVRVGKAGWREAIEERLGLAWWESKAFPRFEPATTWMGRLLSRTEGSRKMLALVTGDVLPEAWADPHGLGLTPATWRKKLLRIGEYWNEERIGTLFRDRGAVLDIVAPEARFGDFLAVRDLPDLPWASRPTLPRHPAGGRVDLSERFGSNTPL
jgi:hypothetical protein